MKKLFAETGTENNKEKTPFLKKLPYMKKVKELIDSSCNMTKFY